MRKRLFSILTSCTVTLAATVSMMSSATNVYYDANGDGNINSADKIFIAQYLNGYYYPENLDTLDFNDNGIISKMDMHMITQYVLSYLPSGSITQKMPETTNIGSSSVNYFVYDAQTGARKIFDGYILSAPTYFDNYSNSKGISTIIGTDDHTIDWSKSGVVKIIDDSPNGFSTGFVIAPHVVATAAHCVYNKSQGCGRSSIQIKLFDTNGILEHTYDAVEYHVPYKYVSYNYDDPEAAPELDYQLYDYALITVEEDLSDYMQFDLAVALDMAIDEEKSVYLTGFPVTVNGNTVNSKTVHNKYTNNGTLMDLSDKDAAHKARQLYYTNDSVSGDSGAPIYSIETYNGTTYYSVIAINFGGASILPLHNNGTRITTELLRFYKYNPNIDIE